ncbi:MAG: prepilin-type N-terminal cleavage/methylation domain-containing protein [Gemmatimonadetes bacterium]|nr:prepilin-type N-terminal cleavage/methylation domain-containing protein [Gemmatimonadota bacterium]
MASRDGFSLIEVIVALVLLAIVVLGIQGMTSSMITATTKSNADVLAMQLAEDRIDLIRMDPQYNTIAARYTGVDSAIAGWPGYRRTTVVTQRRDSSALGIIDWLKITVTVNGPGIKVPVSRTVTIGSP